MAYTEDKTIAGLDAVTALDTGDLLVVGDVSDANRAKKITKANFLTDIIGSSTAIDATKIADGSVTNTEFQYIGGLTSDAQTQLSGKVDKATYDANSILAATTDDTPAAVTVAEQTVVGRLTGGNIDDLAIGIADDAIVQMDSADAADGEYARFTAAGLESRSTAEVISELAILQTSGGTMSGNIALGASTAVLLPDVGIDDGKYAGIIETGVCGATLAFGDLCYFDVTTSKWLLTDANDSATYDKKMGMCVAAGSLNDATVILLNGKIRADSKFPTMTVAAPVYMSETAGEITPTQPSTADVAIRIVGFANTANELYFNPSDDYICVSGTSTIPVVATGAEINTGTDNAKYASPKAIADSNLAMTTDIPAKASASDINTGTDDAKYVTSAAIADSNIAFMSDIPASLTKGTSAELDTGTDDAKYYTASGIAGSHNVPHIVPGSSGNTIISDGTDWTSTANPALLKAGGTMSGDLQLGETAIKLDAVLSTDEKWSGVTMSGTAGATLAVGDACYLASSGKWLLNDGILDGTDTGFSKQLGICVLAASGDAEPTEMLVLGKVRSAAFPAFTVGSPVYLSDTAGDLVVAQPSTTNFAIRCVGYAITAEDLLFNPSNDYIIHI